MVFMGFVVFDEGCLWCRSLAYLICRISGVDIVPLRRAVEIFNARLGKGKIYVFDGGVREGLKPLIKLLLARSRLGALRIIPSYTAYKLARGANLKCGCSYGRRLFIKGLISLALTAIITQKIPLTWGRGEGRHPLSKIRIIKTLRLEGKDLEEAIKKMKGSIDVGNVVDVNRVDWGRAMAAKHIFMFNDEYNVLLVVGSSLVDESMAVVYYEFDKPVEWLKTEALIAQYVDGRILFPSRSINGKLVNNGISTLNTCPPDECSFPDVGCGPGQTCVDICCEVNYDCMWICNPTCSLICYEACGGNLLCAIACMLAICDPICKSICCTKYYKGCVYYGGP
jgi:hypothetical protein